MNPAVDRLYCEFLIPTIPHLEVSWNLCKYCDCAEDGPATRTAVGHYNLQLFLLPRIWGSQYAIRNILPTNCRIATV